MPYTITRQTLKVVIYLPGCRIEGSIHLPRGGRISDFLISQPRKFFPVTDAEVFSITEKEKKWVYKTPFLTINKRYIITMFPRGKWEKLNAKA